MPPRSARSGHPARHGRCREPTAAGNATGRTRRRKPQQPAAELEPVTLSAKPCHDREQVSCAHQPSHLEQLRRPLHGRQISLKLGDTPSGRAKLDAFRGGRTRPSASINLILGLPPMNRRRARLQHPGQIRDFAAHPDHKQGDTPSDHKREHRPTGPTIGSPSPDASRVVSQSAGQAQASSISSKVSGQDNLTPYEAQRSSQYGAVGWRSTANMGRYAAAPQSTRYA